MNRTGYVLFASAAIAIGCLLAAAGWSDGRFLIVVGFVVSALALGVTFWDVVQERRYRRRLAKEREEARVRRLDRVKRGERGPWG